MSETKTKQRDNLETLTVIFNKFSVTNFFKTKA